MGFESSLNVVSNIFTLGGASRLDDAKAVYETTHTKHVALCGKILEFKKKIDDQVRAIGQLLPAAKPVLAKSEKILRKSISRRDDLDFRYTIETLEGVNKFNSDYNAAIGIGSGTIAGGSLALGSWALVGAFGSASTGTAIAGLSGAAASNATLAWLGGGTLAAGGAGVSGGIMMLGGIVAVPLILIASAGTHKKAKEFEEATEKLTGVIAQQESHLAHLPDALKTVEIRKTQVDHACEEFQSTSRRLHKIIRPFGILSVMKQGILKLFRRRPFIDEQLEALGELGQTVSAFLSQFKRSSASRTKNGW